MKKVAIVILSCFKYRYLWQAVIKSLERELREDYKNFDIYISTDNPNNLDINIHLKDNYINFILYRENIPWTQAFIESIEKLEVKNYKKIITTFDDLLITNIRIDLLNKVIKDDKKIKYYKLTNSHSQLFQRLLPFKEFEMNRPKNYLGGMVMSLWDYEFLLSFLRKYKSKISSLNAWEFEKYIPKLLFQFKGLRYQNKNIITYKNLMIKGKLDIFALTLYCLTKNENLDDVSNKYRRLGIFQNIFIYLYYLIYDVLTAILPSSFILKIIKIKRFFT